MMTLVGIATGLVVGPIMGWVLIRLNDRLEAHDGRLW